MEKRGLLFMVVLVAGLFCMEGCSKTGLDTYNISECDIYFGMENMNKGKKQVFVDTTTFSFGDYKDLPDTVVLIRVNALGGVSAQPRMFEFEVVDSLTTAIEGSYYTLDGNTGVIPANATCGYISVHLYYQENMKDRAMWYLTLQLKPGTDFTLNLKQEYVDKENGKYVELLRHWIGISSRIQKPASWFRVEAFFLDFTGDKYNLINEVCHLTRNDWDSMQSYIAEAYWVAVRNHLQVNIDAGTPIMERNERTGKMQIMKVKGLTGI